MSCGVGRRLNSDPSLLWLWCRQAAVALIWHLAWEPPYAAIAALKSKNKEYYPTVKTHVLHKNSINESQKLHIEGKKPDIKKDILEAFMHLESQTDRAHSYRWKLGKGLALEKLVSDRNSSLQEFLDAANKPDTYILLLAHWAQKEFWKIWKTSELFNVSRMGSLVSWLVCWWWRSLKAVGWPWLFMAGWLPFYRQTRC